MPYGTPAYGQGGPGYPYTPPKKSKKPLIIGLSILGVVALLGIGLVVVVGVFMSDKTIATNMAVGDCITELPTDTRVMTLPTTECSQEHAGEVYAVIDMPDGDYPGQSKIDEYQNRCPDELLTIAPDAVDDDSIGIYVLYPTPETWKQNDRAITCIATFDPKRTGSIQE